MTPSRYRKTGLVFASLMWFLVLAGRRSIAVLLVDIETEFSIGHTEAGLAFSSMFLLYGLLQFPSGIFSDIKGRKSTILIAMTIMGLSFILIGVSPHFIVFLSAVLLFGIGSGSLQTAGISMLSDLYSENRGRALGIQSSMGSLSGLIPIAAPVVALIDWRILFFVWGGACILAAAIFWRKGKETTRIPEGASIKGRLGDGLSILKDPEVILTFLITVAIVICWTGYTSFFPTFLIETKGFTTLESGILFSILVLGGIFLKPFFGRLSDKRSKKAVLLLIAALGGSITVLLLYVENIFFVAFLSILLSGTASFFLVTNSFLLGRWGSTGRGGKLGFFRSVTVLAGSPSSLMIGFTASRFGFITSFTIISIFFLASSILIALNLFLQKH